MCISCSDCFDCLYFEVLILELAIGESVAQTTRYMYLIQNVDDHLENDSW